ncbi:MAG: protease [Acidobacteria bacterium]|nr:protease [Acidobacteriota bacterium]
MRRLIALVSVLLVSSTAWPQEGRQGYYRYPTLHDDTLVFAAEGDLWKVSASGGVARRLTTHPEQESHPTISSDGSTLAYRASYEGVSEVYTMPLAGGLPVRQTYEADVSTPIGWTPDGQLAYTTTRYSTLPSYQLVELDLASNTRGPVPLADASEASYGDTDSTLFFVRPRFHGNVTKRYEGGTARKIWKFERGMSEAAPLTLDYDGESHTPMWWDGRLYFISDRDGTMNIWSIDADGNGATQHTSHSGWDAKEASLAQGRIAYQIGADIWVYDIASGGNSMVPISLASDFDQLREKWVDEPGDYLSSAHVHPEGESVVLTARGRVFVAPVGSGRLVQASRSEGVRYRDVVFMPDGDELLALTDETGELEFTSLPANGVGDGNRITNDGEILRFTGIPSPDGAHVTYTDNNNDRWLLEVATSQQTLISTNREGLGAAAWSPDGSWLAYVQSAMNTFAQVWLYEVSTGTRVAVTSDRVNSYSPAFGADGEWLYFLSDRNLRTSVGSPWGPRAPAPYFDSTLKIYEVSLQAGMRSPFKPADELSRAAAPESDEADEANDDAAKSSMAIDVDGIQRRVREVPVEPGNYSNLSVNDGALFWRARETAGFRGHLMGLAIGNDDPEAATIVEGIGGYELSANGKKLMVRRGRDIFVIDARARSAGNISDHRVDLSGWSFSMDVAADFRQLFIDAWRLERDYLYDPGMHGLAWDVVLEKYLELVGRITTRDELNHLIGRVIGELSALHTSVRGGDMREGDDDIAVASLGARLYRDAGAGGYLIDYIYQNDPDYPDELSPLADPDLGIAEGDVIEMINGVDTLSVRHIGALLRNQQNKQVLLRVAPGDGGDSRDVIVRPISNELNLRYSDWEYTRRLEVEDKAEGQVGYVHLRAMGGGDINSWYRQFYPVYDRPGLIIDVRRNRGVNIDSIILEDLMRQAWFYWKTRVGRPTWNMQYAFRGHMVVLVDENTASDGEAFAEGFRRLGMGPVIGARTWGGEIWLSGVNRLSDGGIARAPMMGVYGPEGEWLIEGWGVVPDIEVVNMPHATYNGEDQQLDAAIDYLLQQIAEDPRAIPAAPTYPDLRFQYPRRDQ